MIGVSGTCLRERVHVKKKEKNASVVFSLFPRDGGVCHVLVLVLAATRKDSALRSAWVGGERAGRHVFFLSEMRFVKASYTV